VSAAIESTLWSPALEVLPVLKVTFLPPPHTVHPPSLPCEGVHLPTLSQSKVTVRYQVDTPSGVLLNLKLISFFLPLVHSSSFYHLTRPSALPPEVKSECHRIPQIHSQVVHS
jgi:hypothetical protein